jgi:hypothetical protein
MNSQRKPFRLLAGVLSVVAVVSLSPVSQATGVIGKEDLAGPWAMTLTGDTGCGVSTRLASQPALSISTGTGLVTVRSHTAGCGNPVSTEKFQILTLNANGSGTASLSCGNQGACGWQFKIQVAPDRTVFNLVDITDVGNNFLEGVAIHQ